jgi:hypothetical protein
MSNTIYGFNYKEFSGAVRKLKSRQDEDENFRRGKDSNSVMFYPFIMIFRYLDGGYELKLTLPKILREFYTAFIPFNVSMHSTTAIDFDRFIDVAWEKFNEHDFSALTRKEATNE